MYGLLDKVATGLLEICIIIAPLAGTSGTSFAPTTAPPEPTDTGSGVAMIVAFDNLTVVADILADMSGVYVIEGAGQTASVHLEQSSKVQNSPILTRSPLAAGEHITYHVRGPDGGVIGGGIVFGPDNPRPASAN